MANGSIADTGVKSLLDSALGTAPWAGAKVRLYVNAHTPSTGDILSNYTEASFPGYAPQTLPAFPASALTNHVASATAPPVTFNLTSGTANVYGIFITDSSGTILLGAVQDPNAPVGLSTTVNSYTATVTMSDQSQF